ncbi:MAG TPA: hypothetical protein ENI61_01080 [Ignavibacteria bacterium]|nr:hypothetical protein [Ignavibacteria bacterium]
MIEIKTVAAHLDIEIFVNCPECGYLIDLLREDDTDGTMHDDDNFLLGQMFPDEGGHKDFECDDIVCTKCKTKFNVKGLEW